MGAADREGVAVIPVRGPGWPLRAAADSPAPFGRLGELLRTRGAFSWFVGGGCSLIWLVAMGSDLAAVRDTSATVVGIALLACYGVVFLLGVPVMWALPASLRLVPAGVLLAFSFTLFPVIGWSIRGMWTYVGVLIAMSLVRWVLLSSLVVLLAVGSWLPGAVEGGVERADLWIPAIVLSVSATMYGFARNVAAMNQLRATQAQVAMLAAERERGRMARDLHDILGHSLTVITVKSELAGRLVASDPDAARREIEDVESLARGALSDVRATVNGARSVSIATEIATATHALEAAGIRADLPPTVDRVPAAWHELAGWVVREGVTNVLRHSGARSCRIVLDDDGIEVDDDGRGPTGSEGGGLTGLRDRIAAAGGRLVVGRSTSGGFRMRATWPEGPAGR